MAVDEPIRMVSRFHRGAQHNALLLQSHAVNLTGDPAGLAALKAMQESNREYLKFLIQEARSVFEHHVDFKAPDGAQFRLAFDVKTGAFTVAKKPAS